VKLTRKKSEERQQAVLSWFLNHPAGTGDEAQAALSSGKLTGEKGPTMSVGMVYSLRKRALSMLPQGGILSSAAQPALTGEQLARLRDLAKKVQDLLAATPGVPQVTITQGEIRITKLRSESETL
jgi:hypothetical protein